MSDVSERIDPLNGLLRGELCAVETYRQAIAMSGNEPGAAALRRLAIEHAEAASALSEYLVVRGGDPDVDASSWEPVARAIEKMSSVLGCAGVLEALKQGEEKGLKDYQDSLQDDSLDDEIKSLIRSTLLPRRGSHVQALDRLIAGK